MIKIFQKGMDCPLQWPCSLLDMPQLQFHSLLLRDETYVDCFYHLSQSFSFLCSNKRCFFASKSKMMKILAGLWALSKPTVTNQFQILDEEVIFQMFLVTRKPFGIYEQNPVKINFRVYICPKISKAMLLAFWLNLILKACSS